MNKEKLMKTYRKLVTLTLVLTLFASLGASFGSATISAQRSLSEFIPDTVKSQLAPDASNYERLATEAVSKVTLFNNKVEELKRRGRVTAQEKASIQSDGNALKSLLGNLRSSLSSIIDKLRSANKLSADFDAIAVNSIRAKKPEAADKLVAQGGARALLNATLSNLGAAISEINSIQSDPLFRASADSVNEKEFKQALGQGLIPVAYTTTASAPPARFAIVVIKCAVLGTRLLIKTIKGTDTQKDSDDFKNCDN
jgi:FtsZ-binding cell division protein ZapB